MKINEVMNSPAYTCTPDESLALAAERLWEHDCGVLAVIDDDGKVGATITDRDICMGALSRGLPLAEIPVADSMSDGVITCRADQDVGIAARLMSEHQLHRLPVVDESGRPTGMLSLNDLALIGEQHPRLRRAALNVLQAVSHHRTAVPAEVASS